LVHAVNSVDDFFNALGNESLDFFGRGSRESGADGNGGQIN
jgi:hypothetical protein